MIEYCEHRFKNVSNYLEDSNELRRRFKQDILIWDTYMIITTATPGVVINLSQKTKGIFDFGFDVDGTAVFARGIKEDIIDFLELVKEENPEFKYEAYEVEPIMVFDPKCKECNDELDIGRVISIEI